MKKLSSLRHNFLNPTLIFLGIILYGILSYFEYTTVAQTIILIAIGLGSYSLVLETFSELFKKHFALDYIALVAVIVSVITGEYLVGAIIALMISTGVTLEAYGARQAKKSLTSLIDRIPQEVLLWEKDKETVKTKISKVKVGQSIFIRKGEVIPLDGTLESLKGLTDESSLTGEPYYIDKLQGDLLRSGTVNSGDAIVVKVTKEEADSTYRKIIEMVQSAQIEKAPLIRLADKYSTFFTLVTFFISLFAYFNLGGLDGVLAVLVVATPCPLIIATPIALLGGVNAAAKQRIIIKKLAVLETLSRVDTMVFDKTGTLTLGRPKLTTISIIQTKYSYDEILSFAAAIERNSLHPLAKTIVEAAKEKKVKHLIAHDTQEIVGKGISGIINNTEYVLRKLPEENSDGMQIEMLEGKKQIAVFSFADVLKKDSKPIISRLKQAGYELFIFTGDKKKTADKIALELGEGITVRAEMKPEDKQKGIEELKKQKKVIAMIGDGINDAPALALADVGMVFSNEEQTASSEAADIVLLGGDFQQATQTLSISKRSVNIAMQSIIFGIGASIICMILASFGLIPPLLGAGIQEVIDVAVILNALRAAHT
ncbi:MAG: Cadmium-translocating P-type ATPase [Patescibacteria group bacterium]|nr:Cadmium-translocating P-type ATPase [Patescibacteria group bacterium]